jgi:hypothetical protein
MEADIGIILQAAKVKIPRGETANHHRQRTAIHCAGVNSNRGHDARENVALLPAIEREVGALAQIAEKRVHPAVGAEGGKVAVGRTEPIYFLTGHVAKGPAPMLRYSGNGRTTYQRERNPGSITNPCVGAGSSVASTIRRSCVRHCLQVVHFRVCARSSAG